VAASGSGALDVFTLEPGAQTAPQVAERIAKFLGEARSSLELALYDVRLPDPAGSTVAGALKDAAGRGVAVRLAYNLEHDKPIPVPPPPSTRPDLIESLPLPTRGIPGVPDLMHHKYVVRDREAVWTGSANWTEDSWTLQENVLAVARSRELAELYASNFDELWETRDVSKSGHGEPRPIDLAGVPARAWFTPEHGPELSHRIAEAIGRARRRVRIASPVITAGPILGTLAEVAAEGRVDLAGVVDGPQMAQVDRQWRENGHSAWKLPLLAAVLGKAPFSGKPSTPYGPDTPHDFMHAKMTVADDTVFLGSFNLSRSGEMNAENVLELQEPGLANRMAGFIDEVRGRYAPAAVPDVISGAAVSGARPAASPGPPPRARR
jgi:phosphatidylserine/phosphatidylglycerophosphate/cardiolipin synthase-like enzyme